MAFAERMTVLKEHIEKAREWLALAAIREEIINLDTRLATLEVTANEKDRNSGTD